MSTADSPKLSELTEMRAKTPSSLAEAVGVDPRAKAYGMYYAGTEARVTDGYSSHGFSYYGVYAPVMSHPVIACAAACRDFGSDESEPKDMLLFRVEGPISFGPYYAVQRALCAINEHLLNQEKDLAEIFEISGKIDLNALRQIGAFESLLGSTAENQAVGVRVIAELDQQITLETIEELSGCNGPGMEALNALVYADKNAARLGLDQERVRRARDAYRQKLLAEVNEHFGSSRDRQPNESEK